MAKKGLSRGLEHLFEQNITLGDETNEITMININDLLPNPYQPRKHFDDDSLKELSQSIKEQGVFQPILVRRAAIGFEIISGERRFRASKLAELEEVPAIIYNYDDNQMMEVALIENIQRENLNIVEEAKSYQMMNEKLQYTQNEIAQKVGKSRSHVANIMRILKLNDNILDLLKEDKISMGHVKTLITIDNEKKQNEIAQKIINEDLNVRQAEELISQQKNNTDSSNSNKKKNSAYKRLEEIFIDKLSTKVEIKGKNKGKIVIEYLSEEDLERILEKLNII